jgi:phage terminase large subunit
MQNEQVVPLQLAKPLVRLLSKPKRVKIVVGGRGSAKSTGVGDIMLMFADTGERICCTREFQNSIDDSVHESLKSEIDRLALTERFTALASEIRGINGGEVFYRGLARNITSMKSLHGVKKLWIEEGESISSRSLRILTPSIRSSASENFSSTGEVIDPPEIWITMNRGSTKDAVAKKYLSRAESSLKRQGWYEDELMLVVEVNWRDNPWFPPELEMERMDDLVNLSRAEYDHIWEGAYSDTVENAIIKPEWFDACIDAHIKLGFEALGQERVSYDPADTGDDKALAYSHGSVIKEAKSTGDGRIDTATDWAMDFVIDVRPDTFTWDADGMGAGLTRQITDAMKGKKIEVEAFRGSEGADSPEQIYQRTEDKVKDNKTNKATFANKRAQYYWILRDRIYKTFLAVEKGQKTFIPDELISFSSEIGELTALRAELCRIPRKFNGSGRIQLMTKIEMKKLEIDSPNLADAVMMLMRPIEVKLPTYSSTQRNYTTNAGWMG